MRNSAAQLTAQLTVAVVRQAAFGLIVLLAAMPLLNALHARFGLGAPPASAVLLMGGSVLACFVGAALIGVLCGLDLKAGRGTRAVVAAAMSVGWSGLVCSVVIPFYGSTIIDHVTEEATTTAFRERGALLDRGGDAVDGVRAGRGGQVARATAGEALDRAEEVGKSGLARLPALSLLFWTLIGPPIGAAFEASRAKRHR